MNRKDYNCINCGNNFVEYVRGYVFEILEYKIPLCNDCLDKREQGCYHCGASSSVIECKDRLKCLKRKGRWCRVYCNKCLCEKTAGYRNDEILPYLPECLSTNKRFNEKYPGAFDHQKYLD